MAVAFRGAAAEATLATTTSLSSYAMSATAQTGDIILVFVRSKVAADTFTCPGFTALTTVQKTMPGPLSAVVLWKIAGGSEPSFYTVTNGGTSTELSVAVGAWSGTLPSAPPFAAGSTDPNGGSNPTALPVTTMVDNSWIVHMYADAFGRTITAPSGFTNRCNIGAGARLNVCDMAVGAAGYLYGSDTCGMSVDSSTAYTVALSPPGFTGGVGMLI